MKLLLLLGCLEFALASSDCEKGPSHWCRDLTTASKCGRVDYCHDNEWKDKAQVSCDVCTFVATIVDTLLKQNVTQNDAQTFVLKLCDSLGNLSTECHNLISKDFYVIWNFVVEEVDPSVICYKLGYCTGSKVVSDPAPQNPVECDLCTFVTQYLETLLKNNLTKEEAENDMRELCTYLGSLASECDTFVVTNFDSVWALLESNLDPGVVCVKLNLCPGVAVEAVSKPAQSNCGICTILATYIDALMAKNVTKLEGESVALRLCGDLGNLGPECDVFVEAHFDSIWALLEKDLEPSYLCVKLNICTSFVQPAKTALSPPQSSPHIPKGIISCVECEGLIDVVHLELEKSSTQAEAMMVALKFCSSLGALDFLCSIIINDTFDTIWATVVKDLSDSRKVCVFLEKCTNSGEKTPKELLPQPGALVPALTNDPPCDLCVALVAYVIDLGEKDNATIEKFAYAFCASLNDPALVTLCENLINTTFIDAWNMILQNLNPTTLCLQLKKCPPSAPSQKIILATTGISDQAKCNLCNAVVEYVGYKAAMNTTETFAMAIAHIVCGYLGNLSTLCDEVVDKSFDQIWKKLVGDLDNAGQLCTLFFCSSENMALVPVHTPSTPASVFQKEHTKRAVQSDVGYTECDICNIIAYVLDSVAMNNKTEEEAKLQALNACALLGHYAPLCTDFVAANFQSIWNLVIKDLDPSNVCVYLKFCNATDHQGPPPPKALPTVTTCEVCKGIAFLLDSLVKNNVSKVDAKALIDEECGNLGVYTQMCVTLVNDYYDDIWNLLINDLQPDFICEKLGLCSNSTFSELSTKQSFECTACEEMLAGMEGLVDENTTEEEAYALMEMFCNVLPADLASQCKSFLKADFFLAWDLFKECVDNPKDCCIKIGVCNTSSVHTNLFKERLSMKAREGPAKGDSAQSSNLLCIVCEYVMKELNSILAENATEAEIQAALDKVCSLIPKSLTSYCDSMVAEYTPQIIKLLLEDTDPKMLCTRLGVCAQSKSTTTHTGTPLLY